MLVVGNDIAQQHPARRFRESRSKEADQLLKEILELKEQIQRKVKRYRETVGLTGRPAYLPSDLLRYRGEAGIAGTDQEVILPIRNPPPVQDPSDKNEAPKRGITPPTVGPGGQSRSRVRVSCRSWFLGFRVAHV
jgi:hypothetical protein